ncbi:MAG TPA: DUF29 domain-containing protein [Bryobacteraceae bacterium]
MSPQELYDRDFFEWTQVNADLLSRGCFEMADIEHIAEELADMGKSDRREVKSFLRRLIMHLLKWQMQQGQRSLSWRASIGDSRVQLKDIFEQSPSLRRFASESIEAVYPDARELAAEETGLRQTAFPAECPYSFDQLMDRGFFPDSV